MRLVVFAGPSGGHFYPALAFSESFKRRNPEARILVVTGKRGGPLVEKAQSRLDMEFEFLPDFPFPRTKNPDFFIRALPFLLKLVQAFLKSEKILRSFKPDVTLGFGSYVSFPGLLVSVRRKIPTLIHEQNRKMGKANAWLARFVNQIALSFEGDSSDTDLPSTVVTGLPLRRALVERASGTSQPAPAFFPSDRFRILLVGGSQGSHSLNRLWEGALESFSDEEKRRIAVVHITGEKDYDKIKAMYPAKGIEARVSAFHERMEELYPEADLAITRAGAGTLFELGLFGLPAIVFPYPHAEGHQELNARYFEERGGVVLLQETGCSPEGLRQEIVKLMNSRVLREQMSEKLKELARPEAAWRLVEATEALVLKNKAELIA